ncbi:hypothetical protein AAFN46_13700 [Pseudomonas sp. CAU 1711]|uniref:hypothetical protein n=1 Tax=Pseudomonas sp. CAU 1711 TaxID=3140356 RepID=UPI0032612CD2
MRGVARQRHVQPPRKRGAYLLAVLVGAYFFTWALSGLAAVQLYRLGMPRSEAVLACTLSGFPLLVALVLWVLPRRRPWRALAALLAGGTAMLLLSQGGA